MLFLILAVACSLGIGMIFKHAARRRLDRTALLTVNYGAAALLAAGLLGAAPASVGALPPLFVGLGLVTGALFIGGFFLLSYATETAGMSLALSVMRLSVVIPVVASWLVWHEVPTVAQQVGLLLACGAFLLMARPGSLPGEARVGKAFLVLGSLFLAGGLVDTLLKAFEEGYGERVGSASFLLLVFATAFGIGAAVVIGRGRQGQWPRGQVVPWGILLGLVNYGSTAFLLEAVARLRGPVVFPLNNIAIVLGGALLGALVWRERLGGRARLGLGVAVAALLLIGSGMA